MFNRLTSSVFQSILKRRDTKIFLSFCLLPILVPFLAGNMEDMKTDYTNSFLSFFDITLLTQYRLTIPVLIFSILISSVFRDEIDSKIMFLYKDIKRSKIFNAKILGLFLVYILYLFGTFFATFITYYGIMLPRFGVDSNFLPSSSILVEKSILSILSVVLLNLITTVMVAMVSIKSKTLVAVLVGIFFTLFAFTAPLLIGVKYVIPTTYANALQAGEFSLTLLIIIGLSCIYFLPSYFSARKNFERIEF
ncbi:MAG: amino acid transporter [Streptococcus sp.]